MTAFFHKVSSINQARRAILSLLAGYLYQRGQLSFICQTLILSQISYKYNHFGGKTFY